MTIRTIQKKVVKLAEIFNMVNAGSRENQSATSVANMVTLPRIA